MSKSHPCALCSAMVESGFRATCSPQAAHFTHDQRICDTCLSTDFSSSPIPEFRNVILRFLFFLSVLVAFVPSSIVLRHYHLHGWSGLLGTIVVAALVAGMVVAVYWFGQPKLIRLGERMYAQRSPDEALQEAERFYYLAVWAALTHHAEFGQQMLAQAKLMGFSDTSRLHDQTLLQFPS